MMTFKVFQLVSGTTYRVLTHDGPRALTPATVNTFFVRIPVPGGSIIGTNTQAGSGTACTFSTGAPGDTVFSRAGDLGDNESGAFVSFANNLVNVSAVVEADTDGDGFGDDSQDACPGVAGSVSGCPRADLGISKSVSQSPGAVGNVTYRLSVANGGPDAAPGVVVSDSLSAGQTLLSATSTAGSCVGGLSVSCSLGSLPAGASATVTLVVRAKAGSATNTATVSSVVLAQAAHNAAGAGDLNGANNSASATVTVVAPAVSGVTASPSTFRLGSLLPKLTKARVGTTIKFKLSEPASTKVEFLQSKPGRKVGKRCKAPTHANRNHKHCTRIVVAGSLGVSGHTGKNKLRFQGRLSTSKRLKPGRYTVRITATDAAGNASKPRTTTITIVKG